jgi:surface antigen
LSFIATALLLLLFPALASSGASASADVTIAVSSSGHQITAHLNAPIASQCALSISAKSKQAHFSPDKVPSSRLLSITWVTPTNAPSGLWTFKTACTQHSRKFSGQVVKRLTFSGNGKGGLVLIARAESSQPGGKGGGDQSCVTIDVPANGGQVCFIGDPFAIYDNGGDIGQCTWYAAGMRPDLDGIDTRDASDWLTQAQGKKPEGTVPVVGSIAVSTTADGGVGHVAYVAGIEDNGTELVLDEANLHNDGGVFLNIVTPASSFNGYIYGGPAGNGPTTATPTTPVSTPAPTTGIGETSGSAVNTWTNYASASGSQGPVIPAFDTVQVSCRATGFTVADGNAWWYLIASSPWGNSYWASADAFYNNGKTSGSLSGTPFFDPKVPACTSSSPPTTTTTSPTTTTAPGSPTTTTTTTTTTLPPSVTHTETTGSVAHTWTNYADAGGTEGPSISSNESVQITCRTTGFAVADGNTWWYKVASSPWNNAYWVSADAFYNNGATSGSLVGTPFFDPAVPTC